MLVDLHTHSTFSDMEEAMQAAQTVPNAPQIVNGVEMGSQAGEYSVHILGYNIDIHNENLLNKIQEMRHARETRLHRMLDKIDALGYHITVEDCDPKNRAVGRPHVAKALVAAGYFQSVDEAFEVLLKRGRPGYEPQPKLSPEEAVNLLHEAGGIAVSCCTKRAALPFWRTRRRLKI